MLIIVESPTKAKKIQSILKVKTMSTVGHFKDLPESQIGVDLATYEPTFVYHEKKANLPKELRAAAQGETVMLAGDPDREGYAISCHIYEEVKSVAKECLRMEIYEVTEYLRDKHGWVIDYELTSKMENFLDLVVENKETWQRFCKGVHNKMGFSIPPVRAVGGGPSEGQLKFANDLAVKNTLVIPEETLKSGKALSKWIEGVVGAKKQTTHSTKVVPKIKKFG